ncbi:Putative uncharacterized protein [Mycoavidus cysteinexigens]|uniref:Uncharacterized protein n=1 Tax=Mycoavidus cysteinexigens TaxID=1553431 RepID=A0A2Z6ETB4_9BURK|nr:hypothetical protein [Mycoavidus cysteinexigens]BBE08631.1 Putative uncharacterized protein [Mycoavidus cysteinexigens]GLR01505.1 hypothetical protein GCM10007934_13170 [Mycoavidus cysteinexigens]
MQPSKLFGIIILQLFFVSACGGGGEKNSNKKTIAQPQIIEKPYFDIETTGNCAIRAVNWALGNRRFISPKEYYEYMENQSMDDPRFSEEQRCLLRAHFKDETKKYSSIALKNLEEAFDKAKISSSASFDPTFKTLMTERGLLGHNKAIEHVIDVIKFKFGLEFPTILEKFDDALAKEDFIDAKGLIILTNSHFDGFYKDENNIWHKKNGDQLSTNHIDYITQLKAELTLDSPDLILDSRILYFPPRIVEYLQNALDIASTS